MDPRIVVVLAALTPGCLASPAPAAESPPATSYVIYVAKTRATVPAAAFGARLRRQLSDGLPTAVPGADTFGLDPQRVWLLEAADPLVARAAAQALSRDPGVAWIEPNVLREPTAPMPSTPVLGVSRADSTPAGFPNDPLFVEGRQWGLDNRGDAGAYGGIRGADIGAMRAWALSVGGPQVRLGVADTGIDEAHPDLQMTLPRGTRIELGVNVTEDPSRSWADSVAHGTAVAGIMAARTGDGVYFDSGVAGVCGGDGGSNPGCRIVPIKITSGRGTSATSFDIARAIVYAVAVGARALNLSFGGRGPSRLERLALRHAITHGCLVVAASGNRGATAGTQPVYPAAYAADGLCLQVGASDSFDRRAVFSSFGPGLGLVAPGVDVWTTFLTRPSAAGAMYPGYVAISGTSAAAPFATGTVGLISALRPELGADDMPALLRVTAHDVGAPGFDTETGSGRLDAAAALRAVTPGVGIWRDEIAASEWIDRGADTLVIDETGPGSMAPGAWEAHLIEARATVALPDSFADTVWVWPRITGTTTVSGGFRLRYDAPFAEIIDTGHPDAGVATPRPGMAVRLVPPSRTFTLRGFLYRVPARGSEGEACDVPLPADQARFGFTAIGRVRSAGVAVTPEPGILRAMPNPFRDQLVIERPAGCSIELVDVGGRRVRAWAADGSVTPIRWNGRDAHGASVPPGVYWVRGRSVRGTEHARVIKLD